MFFVLTLYESVNCAYAPLLCPVIIPLLTSGELLFLQHRDKVTVSFDEAGRLVVRGGEKLSSACSSTSAFQPFPTTEDEVIRQVIRGFCGILLREIPMPPHHIFCDSIF